jgi:ABC-type transport system involved in multi-copper enzyme maturation permease subunit
MIATLTGKDIKQGLFSIRGIACSLMIFLLVTGVAFTHGQIYKSDIEQHYHNQTDRNAMLADKAHYNRMRVLSKPARPPEKMQVLFGDNNGQADQRTFFENPLSVLHRTFDLTDVMVYLLGIIALILSFDAISGDRESGMLRALSSFSVPRRTILLTKLLSGLITVAIPLLLSLAVAVAYLLLVGALDWNAADWLSLALVVVASLLHFSCYFCMGLLASTTTSRPASSIIVVFLFWITFAFIIPSTSAFIAAQIHPVPGIEKISAEIKLIQDEERDELGREFQRVVEDRFAREHTASWVAFMSMSEGELTEALGQDETLRAAYAHLQREVDSAWTHANQLQNAKAQKLRENITRRIDRQEGLAQAVSLLSPSANLTYILEGLSLVGEAGSEHFRQERNEYVSRFSAYVEEQYAARKRANPKFDVDDFLDVSGFPQFAYRGMSLGSRWSAVQTPIAIIVIFNIVFFITANLAFQRYDIR